MHRTDFDKQHGRYRALCQAALEKAAQDTFAGASSKVSCAARYALLENGKRVRGVLVQAVGEMLGAGQNALDAFSAAIEMIHAFSLIHDDLPSMDNSDTRRGRPSVHIAFGEATALLAGDLLAVAPFEVIARCGAPPDGRMAAVELLAAAAGGRGMIYGQELDLRYENMVAGEEDIRLLQEKKTGALITAAAALGVLAAGRGRDDEPPLMRYAANIGLAFQIVDDLLDATATAAQLGKPAGSDAVRGKSTFVTLFGQDRAREKIFALTGDATDKLRSEYGEKADFLCAYAENLAARVN